MANYWNNSNAAAPQRPGATNIPGENQYWEARNNGITWTDPGGWASQSGVDPNTGALTGPGGLVPANYGLQFQALHDQAIWRQQQQFMSQGMNYYRGALGLLQSFRPGGGAALESNIYGQLGQASFQRAQLTQPMDLLGDYRRHESAVARQKANRAQERQLAIQVGAIAAGAVTGGLGYAAIGAGLASGLGSYLGSKGQAAATDPNQNYGNAGLSSQSTGSTQPVGPQAPMQGPTTGPSMTGPQSPMGGGGGSALGAQAAPGASAGAGAPQAQAPGAMQPGQQSGQKSVQPGQGQQQGAMGMGGPPPVGLDGNFSAPAYAVRSAQVLQNPIQQMALARIVADERESDPVLRGFSMAIDQRLVARYRGVA